MTQFVQLHLLAAYPPSNPNRDDTGRPKTAMIGGSQRQRISSQSLKRAWRESKIFEKMLKSHLGTRTRLMGLEIKNGLTKGGMEEKAAIEAACRIAEVFGKLDGNAPLEIKQLAHFSPEERTAIETLTVKLLQGSKLEDADLNLLRKQHTAADIALFGRMLADASDFNTEAACQVAHAFTVHKVALEDDYFSAVDDLNKLKGHGGFAFGSETGFGSGLYYLYLCVDTDSLKKNLSDNADLARTTLEALLESAATVAPSGMQNRFGNRVAASYILVERGDQQPRSLAAAFFKPVSGEGWIEPAIEQLEKLLDNMDKVYGVRAHARQRVNLSDGNGGEWEANTPEWKNLVSKEKEKEKKTLLDLLKDFVGGVYDA